MAFVTLDLANLAAGKPVDEDLMEQVKDNEDFLYGSIGAAGLTGILPNGSFEIDSDSDNIPDNWTFTAYPGGTGTITQAADAHGANAFSMVHPGGAGNGGGYLESDYSECSEYIAETLHFVVWDTASAKNIVEIRYYTDAKVYISTDTAYSSTTTGTTPTPVVYDYTPPATARFIKVRLIGGYTDTDSAGTTYYGFVAKDIRITQDHLDDYTAGSRTLVESATEETSTATSGYTKIKELGAARKGVVTTSFQIKEATSTVTVYGRIYVNDVAVGTARSTASATYQTYTEDISVASNDYVQLKVYTSNATYPVYARNFKFSTALQTTEFALS